MAAMTSDAPRFQVLQLGLELLGAHHGQRNFDHLLLGSRRQAGFQ